MQVDRRTRFQRGHPPRLTQLSDSIYVHRFCEDVRLQMLLGRASYGEQRAFEIAPKNEALLWKTVTLFGEPYEFDRNRAVNRRAEVADVISEFIVHVASDLAIKGVSFWEIAKVHGDTNIENALPTLVWISGEVQEQRESIRQRTVKEEESSREPHIDLPKSQAAIFRLPECLGTPCEHLRGLEVLEQASTIFPGFYRENLGADNNGLGV